MPYTIGTSHGPFTGTGSFVIAKPAGIRTIVTNIPSWTGHENTSPLRYHRLGRFTLGNSHGFSESQLLEYAQQLVYPIPAIWELLAYDINDGASCTFYELVDVPDLTLKQPWDRTPLQVGNSVIQNQNGGASLATALTYTVPAGRRLMLQRVSVIARRQTVATAGGAPYGVWNVNGTARGFAQVYGNTVGFESKTELAAGGLLLAPGDTLTIQSANGDTGGNISFYCDWAGFLFDA